MTRPRVPAPPFVRFLLRRAGALVLLSIGITLVAFALTQLVPSDPVAANLGEQAAADPAAVAAFRERYGLDEPIPVQYWRYLTNLLHGDLGESLQDHQPVRENLSRYIPATAELALLSTVVAVVVGVAFGIAAAVRRNRLTDHALRVFSLAGISMPTFWIALVALYLFFFRLGWFPGGGANSVGQTYSSEWARILSADFLRHLILPALALALYLQGLPLLLMRTNMLEVMQEDFVTMARMKGLSEWRIVIRHAARNALLPVITAFAISFGQIVGGNVVVETVFSWPGLGRMLVAAVSNSDYPLAQGAFLLITVCLIAANLVAELLYSVLDPRVSHARVS